MGTSLGFLYVLDCNGRTRDNFPVTMAEIQARPPRACAPARLRARSLLGPLADSRGRLVALPARSRVPVPPPPPAAPRQ